MSTTSINTHNYRTTGTPLSLRLAFAFAILLTCLGAYKSFAAPEATVDRVTAPPAEAATASPVTRLTPIEELQVGQRVLADSPDGDIDEQFGDTVVPSEWRKLTLTSPKDNGTVSHITLLRPAEWIEREQAVVDGHVYIRVPECGIDGNARIHSIEACPETQEGFGQIVTGTFRHIADKGIELRIAGESESIRCTPNHRFWSEDQQSFVRADQLSVGETLRSIYGPVRLSSARPILGKTEVFNLEVHRTHVYNVAFCGLLVHNGNTGDCIRLLDRIDIQVAMSKRSQKHLLYLPKKAPKGEIAVKATQRVVRDPFKGWDPSTKVQDAFKGTGQLAAMERTVRIKGIDTRSLKTMTLEEVHDLMNPSQWKTFSKYFSNRDLRHGK